MTATQPEFLDVVIVGGGVSGVYSAWRMLTGVPQADSPLARWAKARPDGKLAVNLYERTHRIGGRLLSVTPPNMPHIRCELGGMRYMSSQTLIRSLVENKLGLDTRPLPVAEPENIAYLRGKHLRLSELNDPTKLPYNLDWAERSTVTTSDLLIYAVQQIVPGIQNVHGSALQALLEHTLFNGKPIYQQGFWNLLAQLMGHEAYAFSRDTVGYDTASLNWNALDTILLNFDFTPGITYKAIVKGYEEVPLMLEQQFRDAGGTTHLGWTLKSFDNADLPDGSKGVRLTLYPTQQPIQTNRAAQQTADFHEHDAKDEITILTRALVLAMPRRSLELLDQTGAVLGGGRQDAVHQMLRSVTPIPLFKMFVCYDTPWWEAVGVTQGRSLTDLPIRQCYYWGVEGEQYGADPTNRKAVLLATYDDSNNVDFWSGFTQDRTAVFRTRWQAAPGEQFDAAKWQNYEAPPAMSAEIHRQLKMLHNMPYAPEPGAAVYMDWGQDPYGGGVNFWNIHARSWELIPRIVHPVASTPVYICGEAYSNAQGWVEGALQTAEILLHDQLQLEPPNWVVNN